MQTNKLSDDDAIDQMPEAEDPMASYLDSFQYTEDNINDDKFSYDDEDKNDNGDFNIAAPSSQSDKNSNIEEDDEAPAFADDNFNHRHTSTSTTTETPAFGSISLVAQWDDNDEAANKIDAHEADVYGTEIDQEPLGNFWGINEEHKMNFACIVSHTMCPPF